MLSRKTKQKKNNTPIHSYTDLTKALHSPRIRLHTQYKGVYIYTGEISVVRKNASGVRSRKQLDAASSTATLSRNISSLSNISLAPGHRQRRARVCVYTHSSARPQDTIVVSSSSSSGFQDLVAIILIWKSISGEYRGSLSQDCEHRRVQKKKKDSKNLTE